MLTDRAIGCDDPILDDLTYEVTLSDGVNEHSDEVGEERKIFHHYIIKSFQIKINITDINNKVPQIGSFDGVVYLYENSTTGDLIRRVLATDADRDRKLYI